MSYNVTNKGKFSSPKADSFVNLRQFLLIREEGKKFLLLKLSNERKEELTGLKLQIAQKDSWGIDLGVITADFSDLKEKPCSEFVLDKKIALSDACVDFTAKIISADFGSYTYVPNTKKTVAVKQQSGTAQISGITGNSVRVRKTGSPAAVFIITLILLALSVFAAFGHLSFFTANAQTFFYSDAEYAFENNDKSAGSRIYAVGCKKNAKEIVIEESIDGHIVAGIAAGAFLGNTVIEKITIKGAVEISENAFKDCKKLRYINLEKATSIQSSAFAGCGSLASVDLQNVASIQNSAFADCIGLKEINAASLLNLIGSRAFDGCVNLDSVRITGDGVLDIKSNAFSACTNLTTVEIGKFINYPSNPNLFSDCLNIQTLRLKNYNYSFDYMGISYAFSGKNTISELFGFAYVLKPGLWLKELVIDYCGDIPANFCYGLDLERITINGGYVYEVGSGAFKDCIKLKYLSLPSTVKRVEASAFANAAITAFDGAELIYIGAEAFFGCTALSLFNLTNNTTLTAIENRAFAGCVSLASFYLPQSLISIGESTFKSCSGIKSLSVPQSVTTIGAGAFYDCAGLQEITLPFIGDGKTVNNDFFAYVFGAKTVAEFALVPPSLKSVIILYANKIGTNAFYNCHNIEQITIRSGLLTIDKYAFSACGNLNNFIIPDTVTAIGTDAFEGCYKLFELYNLSGLGIVRGSQGYGKAGYYALKIYKSLSETKTPKVKSDGYEFVLDGDKEWYLTNIDGSVNGEIKLPAGLRYNGSNYNSYKIAKYMAAGNNSLTRVYIPLAVTEIGEYAFYNCARLSSVVISENVLRIESRAFYRCFALCDTVILSKSISLAAGDSDSNGYAAYYALRVSGQEETPLPVVEVNEFTFAQFGGTWYLIAAPYAAGLSLPETFTYNGNIVSSYNITENAFAARYYTVIVIPDSVKKICASQSREFSVDAIYYDGTEEDWQAIIEGIINSPFTTCEVYYKDDSSEAE